MQDNKIKKLRAIKNYCIAVGTAVTCAGGAVISLSYAGSLSNKVVATIALVVLVLNYAVAEIYIQADKQEIRHRRMQKRKRMQQQEQSSLQVHEYLRNQIEGKA